MVRCCQQRQVFHHLVHPAPEAESQHHHSWWNPCEAIYLSITFDKRQTWKPHIANAGAHIAKAEAKAGHRLVILHKLAGTFCRASKKILKTVYQGTLRPHLVNSPTAGSTTAKINQQDHDKVQNQALHLITGAMWSIPITKMEKLTGAQPQSQRRVAKILMHADNFRPMVNHHKKTRLEGLAKNWLKRSSFVHNN